MVSRPGKLSLQFPATSMLGVMPPSQEPSTAEIMAELVGGCAKPVVSNQGNRDPSTAEIMAEIVGQFDNGNTKAANPPPLSLTAILADMTPSKFGLPNSQVREVNPFSNVFNSEQQQQQQQANGPTKDVRGMVPSVVVNPVSPTESSSFSLRTSVAIPSSPELQGSFSDGYQTDETVVSQRSRQTSITSVTTTTGQPSKRKRCTVKLSPYEKKERRMQQNRTAAARCRVKKQESMARMSQDMEVLKHENGSLKRALADMEKELTRVKQALAQHQHSCQLRI